MANEINHATEANGADEADAVDKAADVTKADCVLSVLAASDPLLYFGEKDGRKLI